MTTKKLKTVPKRLTAKDTFEVLSIFIRDQKKINAELYNLILQAGDEGTLRTKINKVHDRVTKLESLKTDLANDRLGFFTGGVLLSIMAGMMILMAIGVM